MVNFVLSGKFYQVFRMCFPKFCQMIMKVQSVREYVEIAMVHIITPTRASFFNGITHFPLMPTYRSLNIWLVIIPDIRTWYLYTSPEDLKNLLRTVKTGSKQRRIRISGNLPSPKALSKTNMPKDNETNSEIFSYLGNDLIQHSKAKPYILVTNKMERLLILDPLITAEFLPVLTQK